MVYHRDKPAPPENGFTGAFPTTASGVVIGNTKFTKMEPSFLRTLEQFLSLILTG